MAVSTMWGSLVEPKTPEGVDLSTPFLTGFQVAASNNAKMRALERQNQQFQLAEQRMQMQHEIAMERNQRQIDRLEAQKDRWGDLFYLSDLERKRKENQFTERMNIQTNSREAMAAAQGEITALRNSDDPKQRPGGENFPYLYGQIINKYGGALQAKDQLALRNQAGQEHNAAHARDISTYKLMKQTLDDDVGNLLGYDANLRPDYSGVFHPGSLKAKTEWTPSLKNPLKVTPTGVYEVQLKSQAGTRTGVVTPEQLTQFNKRYQDVQKRYESLTNSRFMNDPDAGITPGGPGGEKDPAADEIQAYRDALTIFRSTDPRVQPEQKEAAARILFSTRK